MSTVPASLEPTHFSPQTIYCGDCAEILAHFPANSVDLVYIDPPFNSNRNYEVFWGDVAEKRAFEDRYGDALAYIEYMRPRVVELHRVLKTTGSFYYHCDWHASHYIKVMLDEIFGANFFQNEIVWLRTTGHSDSHRFNHSHDTLFFYSRAPGFKWNPQYAPFTPEYVQSHYSAVEPGTGRRFTTSDLQAGGVRNGTTGLAWRGIDPTPKGKHWQYPVDQLDVLEAEGKIVWPERGKMPRYKRYLDEAKGMPVKSVWVDVPPVNSQARERLGYPTQKPLALLERIIRASSNPGDIVLDAFCGCGTTLVAAQQLGRKWVGIDISPTSCNVMGQRLEEVCGMRQAPPIMGTREVEDSFDAPEKFYRFSNLPRSAEQLRKLPGFEFENWAVLQLGEVLKYQGHQVFAQANRSKVGDWGLDGRIYLADKVEKRLTAGDLPLDSRMGGTGERQKYLPIQVKNTDQVGRGEIDLFEKALRRDGRPAGFFIGWDFSGQGKNSALAEIDRLRRQSDPVLIFPVRVEQLIAETFNIETLALMGR